MGNEWDGGHCHVCDRGRKCCKAITNFSIYLTVPPLNKIWKRVTDECIDFLVGPNVLIFVDFGGLRGRSTFSIIRRGGEATDTETGNHDVGISIAGTCTSTVQNTIADTMIKMSMEKNKLVLITIHSVHHRG